MKRLVILSVLALTACGTMEPNSSFSGTAVQAGGTVTGPGDTAITGGTTPSGQPQVTTANGQPAVTTPGGGTVPGGNGQPVATTPGGGTVPVQNAGPNVASDVGVTPTSITIGNVTGVSGALGPNAFGVTLTGLKVWVAAINAAGGINGRKIILNACDDAQDSSQNLTCTQNLLPKVFAFIDNNSLSSSGSAHYEFQAGVPDLGFPLNNGYYKYPNMFSNQGTDYPRDGKQVGFNGVLENTPGVYRWLHDHLGVTRAAYFFYSQQQSIQQGKAQEQDAAAYGIKTVYEGGGSSGENLAAPNFDSDVLAMKNMGANAPQVIFDTIDTNGNQKLCQSMDRFGFTVKAKVSTLEAWDQSVGSAAWSKPCRDSVFVVAGALSYADTGIPEVAKYVDAFNKFAAGSLQSEFGFEGYITGVMFGDYLTQAGPNPTRKGFIAWLDNLPPLDQPNTYTAHGMLGPLSYRVDNPKTLRKDCATIAQWQDSAGTFVTRNPLTNCYEDPLVPTPSSDDGS